ncbi:TRP (Transient receptor potential) channel family [Trichostrongylus colubriformis]|uniref:TRP (Transient receptor potential) channel family n=1 Tax=Trichostrongylus colubriformis TaxID=6319 RepID=A0AAN8FX33_TRICO
MAAKKESADDINITPIAISDDGFEDEGEEDSASIDFDDIVHDDLVADLLIRVLNSPLIDDPFWNKNEANNKNAEAPAFLKFDISHDEIVQLCAKASASFLAQPALIIIDKAELPLHVVADLHGNLPQVLRVFKFCGIPQKETFLFLGDYVDRGVQGIEVITLLFCLKIRYPYQIREEDSLRLSRSRINAYRALASPSLICLSAKDPILYAFELSWELRRLSYIENEFRSEYQELSQKCQKFSVNMLDQVRGSKELEIVLNHTTSAWEEVTTRGTPTTEQLARLKLAIKLRQKRFVAHPNCQQLLSGIWYEGLPGFRNRNIVYKCLLIAAVGLSFPILSISYLIAPKSAIAQFTRKPFVKFLSHSASYIVFLALLIMASQRIDRVDNMFREENAPARKEGRGPAPTPVEVAIILWVLGLIWVEIKQLWDCGLHDYCHNLWNILDFITNSLYLSTLALRAVAYYQVNQEMKDPRTQHIGRFLQRRDWDAWDPTLVSECVFATANIFSSLKLVHIFTVNPYLGPLKISLGRMVLDILKFFLVYALVLFAFACGLNQLLWYYGATRQQECEQYKSWLTNPSPTANAATMESFKDSCDPKYRSTSSIYHTSETLFWAMFGLIDLSHFTLKESHYLTEWTGKTIFGSYSCCSIIVLLNMLIAMMSNSYQYISNQADVEWKFARSKLFVEYFDDTATLPPPFNIIPSPKSFYYGLKWICDKYCGCSKAIQAGKQRSMRNQKILRVVNDLESNYRFVTRNLIKRYIAQMQRMKQQNEGVSEDDVNEIKQDISAFRYELLGILRAAGFNTGHADINQKTYNGEVTTQARNKRRSAMAERRLKKGLPEFDIPIPESFQNVRKNSLASLTSGDSQKLPPIRLPHLNWKRFKKKVSFKHPSRSIVSVPAAKTKSLSLDLHGVILPKTEIKNQISNGAYRRTSNERPPLQKQRRKSGDTVLELECDDLL